MGQQDDLEPLLGMVAPEAKEQVEMLTSSATI